MKKFVPILLIAITLLSAGCITPSQEQNKTNNTTTPKEDISLEAPEAEPLGLINNSSPSFSVEFSEKVIILNFSVDGEGTALNSTDKKTFTASLTNLDEGNHSVYVKAEDAVGNQAEKNFSFTVDSKPPELDINIDDGETFNEDSIDLEIKANEEIEITGSSLSGEYVNLDTEDNKTFTATLEDLDDGDYELRIKTKDRAGNKKEVTIDFEVDTEVDETPPNKITGLTAESAGDGESIDLSWDKSTASDFDKYKIYRSDDELNTVIGLTAIKSIPSKTSTSYTAISLTEGVEYCFAVTAVDKTGNERKADVTDACAEVNAAPEISNTEPDDTVDSESITISFETDKDAICNYALVKDEDDDLDISGFDDDDLEEISDEYRTSHSESESVNNNTEYNVYAICEDENGAESDLESWGFDVEITETDTTAPTITIDSPTQSTILSSSVWLNVSTSETVDSCSYNHNSSNYNPMDGSGSSWYLQLTGLADGFHEVNFSCDDSAGNTGTEYTNFTVDTSDNTAPSVEMESPQNDNYSQSLIWINVSTNETVSECTYSLNGDSNETMSNSSSKNWYKNVSLSDDSHEVVAYCNDTSGNIGESSSIYFTIDTTAPAISNVSNSSITNSSANITWDTNESATSEVNYGIKCDNLNNTESDGNYVTSHSIILNNLSNGTTYHYSVKSEDKAGKQATKDNSGNCYSFTTNS